jgi:hypothetical protein
MNFRLTKVKVIVSIIVILAWIILLNIFMGRGGCGGCSMAVQCQNLSYLVPVHISCVCCFSINNVITLWLIILVPGILTYLIWSLFQKKNISKRKK